MGISYDPSSRKWNIQYEKTDYKVDHPTDAPTDLRTNINKVLSRPGKGGAAGWYVTPDYELNAKNAKANKDKEDE